MVCCPGESPSDRHPTLETSTIDNLTVWKGGNTIQSNSKEQDKTNNDGRIKGKRRAELSKQSVLSILSYGKNIANLLVIGHSYSKTFLNI